ncbi:hypothetical protein ACWGB8_21020 [Kitasatospora sp. NPDC054939]
MAAAQDRPLPGRAAQHRIGVLALEVSPAYISDRQATDNLGRIANDIGTTTDELLACRRYALSGDVRAMDGW